VDRREPLPGDGVGPCQRRVVVLDQKTGKYKRHCGAYGKRLSHTPVESWARKGWCIALSQLGHQLYFPRRAAADGVGARLSRPPNARLHSLPRQTSI
jgi:hypothetical protein